MSGPAERVVVTGLGAITPLGGDVKSTWSAMLNGECGVGPLTDAWAADLPVRIAARAAVEPAELLGRVEARRLDRATQFGVLAARQAWADAGYVGRAGEDTASPLPDRLGVVLGCGMGGVAAMLDNHETMLTRGGRRVSPHTIPMIMPNGAAAQVSIELNAQAGVHAPTSACATGAEAIAQALDMIRLGRADVVIAGGTEAIIHPLTLHAFANMQAMSRRNDDPAHASRPYDMGRDGFVMGEGAGILILESASHAARRRAPCYAELVSAGISADAHHIASPPADGEGMARALRRALSDGGLTARDVTHVNAHATSTPQGDLAESTALRTVLGSDGYCVSATKSMTGHLMGAAGSVEAVVTALTVRDRVAPATISVTDLDPGIGLDVVLDTYRLLLADPLVALSNSSGFGGHNVVLAFRSA